MRAQLPSATSTLGTPHMGTTVMDLDSLENCFVCFIQFEILVELSETICDHIVNEVYEWFEFRAFGKSPYQIGGDVTISLCHVKRFWGQDSLDETDKDVMTCLASMYGLIWSRGREHSWSKGLLQTSSAVLLLKSEEDAPQL